MSSHQNSIDKRGQPVHADVFRTPILPHRRRRGRWRRSLGFLALAAVALAAGVGAVLAWQLWWQTLANCVDTYFLKTKTPDLFRSADELKWQEVAIALDISSFSALILALTATVLCLRGLRNTLGCRLRAGRAYKSYAYDHARYELFSERFQMLCIRFGLLGTLLSFLLAAISQMGNLTPGGSASGSTSDAIRQIAAQSAGERSGQKSLGVNAKAVVAGSSAAEPSSRDADGASSSASASVSDASGNAEANASPRKTTSRDGSRGQAAVALSERSTREVFLLLCASLVSTFVGALVAYVVVPPLNTINGYALGLHQLPPVDPEKTSDDFLRRMDQAAQRLTVFEEATKGLLQLMQPVSRIGDLIERVEGTVNNLLAGADKAVAAFANSARAMTTVNGTLQTAVGQLGQISKDIDRTTTDARKRLSTALSQWDDAAKKHESAARVLQSAADAAGRCFNELRNVGPPIQTAGDLLRRGWEILTGHTERLAILSDRLTTLRESLNRLDTHLQHQEQKRAHTAEAVRQRLEALAEPLTQLEHRLARSGDEMRGLEQTTARLSDLLAQIRSAASGVDDGDAFMRALAPRESLWSRVWSAIRRTWRNGDYAENDSSVDRDAADQTAETPVENSSPDGKDEHQEV